MPQSLRSCTPSKTSHGYQVLTGWFTATAMERTRGRVWLYRATHCLEQRFGEAVWAREPFSLSIPTARALQTCIPFLMAADLLDSWYSTRRYTAGLKVAI